VDIVTQAWADNGLGNVDILANAAILHYDFIVHILSTVHVQHEALRIASTSLDLHALSISDAFESFAGSGRRELEKQAHLLQGLDLDLEVISKIRIHSEFLSSSVRKAVEAGEKARTLGDYVSNVKMRQVGEACAKTHSMSPLDRRVWFNP
jgi:autophagy-related protein 11